VVARGAPEILSAGDAKRKASSMFAAFRRHENTQKPAHPWFSAGDDQTPRRIVTGQLVLCLIAGEIEV
jgi:hypothetical protein